MRFLISAVMVFSVLATSTTALAQTKRGRAERKNARVAPAKAEAAKPAPSSAPNSREILARLQTVGPTSLAAEPIKLTHFLQEIHKPLVKQGKEVALSVDEQAFREEYDFPNTLETEIQIKSIFEHATVLDLLRQAVRQVPRAGALIVRAGRVEIVPAVRAAKEFMLNQTFHVDFKEKRLEQAIEELTDLTGVSIVLDSRARQKAQTTVTVRFNDDVALQDAVRMLADMADLKIVHLVTGLYVTTPDHAPVLQKELQRIYEPWTLNPAMVPQMQMMPCCPLGGPMDSPLTPPLPPRRNRADMGV